ncbi:MAG TPA: hypothetical protein ENN19_07270, partial [Chloroflexi bacterium]|nr:hypothetical protein [Chloroflexota bacterium]
MKTVDKILIAILSILTISVLGTGGLAIYLAAKRHRAPALVKNPAPRPADTPTAVAAAGAGIGPDIAFARSYLDEEGEIIAICTTDAEGKRMRQISNPDLRFCLEPAWSPDGVRVAYVGTGGADNEPLHVWVSAVDGSTHVKISQSVSNIAFMKPAWSLDGTRVAFFTWDRPEVDRSPGTVHVARADGAGIERSITFPTTIRQIIRSPASDDLLVVSGDEDGSKHVHLIPASGAAPYEVFRGSLTVDWAPGAGDPLAMAVGDYTAQTVRVVDLPGENADGSASRTLADGQAISDPPPTLALQPVEIAWAADGAHVAVSTAGHFRQGYATNLD